MYSSDALARFHQSPTYPAASVEPENTTDKVVVKVHGVFPSDRGNSASSPENSISLSPCVGDSGPDRYAIRAGRNLPDKEFRYLRTVIVTAAVYRGFRFRASPPN